MRSDGFLIDRANNVAPAMIITAVVRVPEVPFVVIVRFDVFKSALYVVVFPDLNSTTAISAVKVVATIGNRRVSDHSIVEFVHGRLCICRDREECGNCAADPFWKLRNGDDLCATRIRSHRRTAL